MEKLVFKKAFLLLAFIFLCFNFSGVSAGIFSDFSSWNYSENIKSNDFTFDVINMITRVKQTNYVYSGYNFVDINGDGLIDVLYSEFEGSYSPNRTTLNKTVILYNQGDNNFKIGYKCVYSSALNGGSILPKGYYGDCAQTNSNI